MSFFDRIFGTPTGEQPVVPAAPATVEPLIAQSFAQVATSQLDSLAAYVKKISIIISPEVYSEVRSIDDSMRPLLKFLDGQDVGMENQVIITKMITEYVPDPLEIFVRLSKNEQHEGSPADKLLLEQFTLLSRNAKKIDEEIRSQVMKELQTQAMFIRDRFEGA